MTKKQLNKLILALLIGTGSYSVQAQMSSVTAIALHTQTSFNSEASQLTEAAIKVVDFNGLKPYLEKGNDTTYIINFWATWCAPCIKELPYFQQINDEFADKKLKVLLVSLDFERQIESRLIPFIKKHKVTPEVIVLSDPDSNAWINKVDQSWSGSIPATIFYNKDQRMFFEKEFTYAEIRSILELFDSDEF